MICNPCIKLAVLMLLIAAPTTSCLSQEANDSLAYDFRSFVAKNFSRYRTMNFYYETKLSHDYTLTRDGKDIEQGRKTDIHAIRFSTMVPLLKQRKLSLYANIQYNSFLFKNGSALPSAIFHEEANDYYAGGLNGAFYTSLFHRPLVFSADITVDAWKKGWGRLQGRFSAMTVLANSQRTTFGIGLLYMTLYNSTPLLPIVTYWHRFNNPHWSVDITLPSQFYLRYQLRTQRISLGASMASEGFYLKPESADLPEVCFYSEAVMKPEVCYEYIINRHFYLSARAGLATSIKGGLFTKGRKGIKASGEEGGSDPLIEQDHSALPFFNFGISYSLFK